MRTADLCPIENAPKDEWVCGELVVHLPTHDTSRPRFFVYRGERDGVMKLERASYDGKRRLLRLGKELDVPLHSRNEYVRVLRMRVVPC